MSPTFTVPVRRDRPRGSRSCHGHCKPLYSRPARGPSDEETKVSDRLGRPDRVRHPIFARFYQRVSAGLEVAGAAEHRARLLRDLTGRVVEVGAGNGLNFAHYPDTVTEVVAVEPEPYLRARATEATTRARARVTIRVVDGTATSLPLPDASVDAAVASLVLCSVPDQPAALAELRRVLRPGGELRFYEHVLATDARLARTQRRLDPIWTHMAGGCHVTRDTAAAIEHAGFTITECDRFPFEPGALAKLAAPHILGRATAPG
ncbi:MAG: class I SAM-dependent methyltransferase [Actinobacteria bacterium]|nr:class I SAM-dependent methyltransferase [Actinomycetota bacterium]